MITRRRLLGALAAAAAAPRTALAQSKPPVLIGWLESGSREANAHYLAAFKAGLEASGWKEGAQYTLEERWANGRADQLDALARDLAAKRPALIVAAPSAAVRAAAKAVPGTPIVQASGGSPVDTGHAASLAHPGGMVTGLSNIVGELAEKYPELLVGAVPKLQRVGFLVDTTGLKELRERYVEMSTRAAGRHSVKALFAEVGGPEEIESAMARLGKGGAQALIVLPSNWILNERRRVIELALARRWPVMAGPQDWADDGALLAYSVSRVAGFRRAAWYVDRILRGTKPGDLPIEQPMRVELALNLRTAKALKLQIPRDFAMRADRVIE